jgi:cytosine deaminase
LGIAIPPEGHAVLANATVPRAVMGEAGSGALERCDITIADGRIAGIGPAGTGTGPGRVDLDGGLVLPCFVDLHTHLDKGHIWPRKANPDGTWMGALIAVGEDAVANWSGPDVERRMEFALRCAYAHGTAAIRTHLDSSLSQYEITWDVFERVRERWAGRVELQGVALYGPDLMLDREGLGRIAARVAAAGGVLGGSTAVHPDNPTMMRNLIELAGKHGLDIDLHCDETADPAASALLSIADAVNETGYTGSVVAGHCCALARQDSALANLTIDAVAKAGITVVSLPMCNLYLQDRHAIGEVLTPGWRGVTLLKELKAAGVRVAISSDNTRDPFYAYGDLDGLEVLREGARIIHFDHPMDEAFCWARSVGADPASAAGLDYAAELREGASADLVLFRARSWTELMARPQADRTVLRAGQSIDTSLPDYRELDDLMGVH